jgi:uncharacterized membrane protein
MATGYTAAKWMTKQGNENNVLRLGVVLVFLFLVLRLANFYGELFPWQVQERGRVYTFLSFLNITKYPPSLLFLLITLGLGFCCWRLFVKRSNRFTQFLAVYGKVPFFYFLLHFILISGGSYLWTKVSFSHSVNLAFSTPKDWPQGYQPSLGRVYIVWLLVVLVLYYPCKWYGQLKKKGKYWWLSYL